MLERERIGFGLAIRVAVAAVSVSLLCGMAAPHLNANEAEWTEPFELSAGPGAPGSPVLTSDQYGDLHAFWAEATYDDDSADTVYYSRWSGSQWSPPVDILFLGDGAHVEMSTALVDKHGLVHLTFVNQSNQSGYYASAPVFVADSAHSWSEPMLVGSPIYTPVDLKLARDGLTLNMAYVRFGAQGGVYLQRSADSGDSWSDPTQITDAMSKEVGPAAVSLTRDSLDQLHVVWFEKYLAEGYKGTALKYSRSSDGGITWSRLTTLDKLDDRYTAAYGPNWPDIAAVNDQDLVVVWYGAPSGERHYRWSHDGGETWTPDIRTGWSIVGITDRQDLAVDSNGVVHWVTGGSVERGDGRLFYSYWDSARRNWSDPVTVDTLGHSPHRPTLAIIRGGRLATAWNDQSVAVANWVSMRDLAAPMLPTQRLPTTTPVAEATTAISASEAVEVSQSSNRVPTAGGEASGEPLPPSPSSNGLTAQGSPILVALLPALLLLAFVTIVRLRTISGSRGSRRDSRR